MSRCQRPPSMAGVTSQRPRAAAVVVGLLIAGALLFLLARPSSWPVPGPPERPPGLGDLWSGRAALVYDRRSTSTSLGQPQGGAYSGSRVVVAGGHWYLFNRYRQAAPGCPGGGALGTLVRGWADGGGRWGRPAPAVSPQAGTPWACAATDGDAVFDPAAGTWRFLFQCMGGGGVWAGCYAERRGRDPVGAFTPAVGNPVITRGSLWRRICAATTDRCHGRTVFDEGTFSLAEAPTGGWWIGFHGYDGTDGYRGIARTRTFHDWQVDGAGGTPRDAVLTRADAAGWRESWAPGGPVGPGAAGLIQEDGLYYQLAEVPDRNLACTPGQHWDLGLFRARTVASTHWDQLPAGNPVVYSSEAGAAAACNVEYPGLFQDAASGRTYVSFGRISPDPGGDGIFVHRVEWNRNLLANGDFWRADTEGWHRWPGTSTQLAAQRLPDGSPDGSPWLAFNCGGSCAGGAGVYQDVTVPARLHDRPVAFGGDFRAPGGRAPLDVVLFQLDAAGHTLRSD